MLRVCSSMKFDSNESPHCPQRGTQFNHLRYFAAHTEKRARAGDVVRQKNRVCVPYKIQKCRYWSSAWEAPASHVFGGIQSTARIYEFITQYRSLSDPFILASLITDELHNAYALPPPIQ